MKRTLLVLVAFAVCAALGCSGAASQKPGTDGPGMSTDESQPRGAIANPASTHCLEIGGKLELRESPAGQSGVCIFDDGSRCEEWRLMREQCTKGECRNDDGICQRDSTDP